MSFSFSRSQPEFALPESSRPSIGKILEAIPDGVIIVGSDTRIVTANAAAVEAFSRRQNISLENKRLSEIIRDLKLHEAFRLALEHQVTSNIKIEILGIERRKFNVRIAPVELDETKNAIGFFRDITKVEHLEIVRQEFLSNISHELRTPLTSIIAFVETLEDGAIDDTENNHRFLGVIRRNAERMHRLIDDISELSLIESGRIRVEIRKCFPSILIEEIFLNLSAKAAEKNIELINLISTDSIVFADSGRFEQMLTNLIDNAIKFNRDNGSVIVNLEQNQNFDIILVSDTGEGISSEHQQRIFERFYRTDRARSREIGGTGLGLAIVKHLSRLHGGEVSVNSSSGRGSTFIIELPRHLSS